MHGQTNKQAEGNEDISHYKNISQPTLADIIKHPDKYIQSIGNLWRFVFDITCQVDRNTLNQVVECQREDWHYNQGCQYNNFHKI
jgi:hypothetical protein